MWYDVKGKTKLTHWNWKNKCNKKIPKEDAGDREPLVLTLRNPIKSLNRRSRYLPRYLAHTCASPGHAAPVSSVSSYKLPSCWFGGSCFVGVLHPAALPLFLLPLLGSLSSEVRDWLKTTCSGLCVPRSLNLYVMSGDGSLYLFPPSTVGGKDTSLMMAEWGTDLWV